MKIIHGHWSAARSARFLPEHKNDGLELVFVSNGKVIWDCEGKIMEVRAGELSFTWPWQTHAAVDDKLPLVEIYWVLLPLPPKRGGLSRTSKNLSLNIDLPSNYSQSFPQRLKNQVLKPRTSLRQQMIQLIEELIKAKGELNLHTTGWLYLALGEIELAID